MSVNILYKMHFLGSIAPRKQFYWGKKTLAMWGKAAENCPGKMLGLGLKLWSK